MRLAFVSPLPPLPSGVADYAADLLALVAKHQEIELFHAQETVDVARLPAGLPLHPAASFLDRHRKQPFDLAVYQMGNGPSHDFLYDLVSRVPGLLVLHDLVLHHARAAQFLEAEPVRAWRANPASVAARERAQPVLEAWRAELEYAYPARGARLFAVQLGTVGDLLPYAYPLFRIPVEASRLVAVHNRFMADAVREEVPDVPVECAPMPAGRVAVGDLLPYAYPLFRIPAEASRLVAVHNPFMADAVREEVPDVPVECAPMPVGRVAVGARAVAELRGRLGFDAGQLVVGVFGLLTKEKRPLVVARALARAAGAHPELRLLLVGPVPDQPRLESELERLGVRPRTVLTGRIPLPELAVHIEAADVVAHLRYPTARETSAALLRVLAQGRPTIVSDLEQQADLPEEAVLRVDLADEEAGLSAALLRLAADATLRRELGRAAAAFVSREHAPERVAAAWQGVFERARERPAPASRDWPAGWPRREG